MNMYESHGRVQGGRDAAQRVRAEWFVMAKSEREDGDSNGVQGWRKEGNIFCT